MSAVCYFPAYVHCYTGSTPLVVEHTGNLMIVGSKSNIPVYYKICIFYSLYNSFNYRLILMMSLCVAYL